MSIRPDQELEVDEDDLAPLEAIIAELSERPGSWVNLLPEVEPGLEPPPRNPVVAIFSARGDAVPLLTWTAPDEPGRRPQVGIQHGSGPRALDRLLQLDLGLPEGWWKVADHPRRGLVANVAADAEPADVVWWLLAAGHALSTVPLTGSWLAQVHRR